MRTVLRTVAAVIVYEMACYFATGTTLILLWLIGHVARSGLAEAGQTVGDIMGSGRALARHVADAAVPAVLMLFFTLVGAACIVAFTSSTRRSHSGVMGLAALCGAATGFLLGGLAMLFEVAVPEDRRMDFMTLFVILWLAAPVAACAITDAWWRKRTHRAA